MMLLVIGLQIASTMAQSPTDTTCNVSPLPTNMHDFFKKINQTYEIKTLRKAGVDCKIEVCVLVHENGSYLKHKFLEPCHPWAKKAVEENISMLNFRPGINNGFPTKCWTLVQFRYTTLN